MLPRLIEHTTPPPLKCQGVKTRLVPFVASNILWNGAGRWIEPFAGTASVALNLAPRRVLLSDTNPHLIGFYRALAEERIGPDDVAEHLWREGDALREQGEAHYYRIRQRFNAHGDPLDFVFLNRSCFNGLIRFNRSGGFNVPFCRKPDRFRRAYVTRVRNQVAFAATRLAQGEWELRVADWREVLAEARADDFVYLDPPYAGRHADYYGRWDDSDADALSETVRNLPCGYAVSTWSHNRFRANEALHRRWGHTSIVTTEHAYHVGGRTENRHAMTEALCVHPAFAVARGSGGGSGDGGDGMGTAA